MNILNLLDYTSVGIFSDNITSQNVPISGVTSFVKSIIEFFSFGGYIAVGILIFSLLLKILPLPLDIYSRASSKKSALKMEKLRPELEKLQKQYANNNALYQQKVTALYKKEGYSQFAACLPTLITLVFFIIVINAFTQYSSFAKIDTYNKMAASYSESVKNNENVEYLKYDIKDGKIIINETSGEFEGYLFNNDKGDINELVIKPAQDAAADAYFEVSKNAKFLWVQNIWIEDLPWKKAFVSVEDYMQKTFTYTKGCSGAQIESEIKSEAIYDLLFGSSKLDEVKNKPNGYLILVLLSVGSMLISQLILGKSQKAQLELQSVDGANGQAAQTNKLMTWMMPMMFGIFAFMYTASFSLYLIVSTVFSTATTGLINKIVEKTFEKNLKKEEEEKFNKRYGHLTKK